MSEPNLSKVNEAWVVFKLNDAPMQTSEGDFNVIALMDIANCHLLGSELIPASSEEPSTISSKRLLETGESSAAGRPKFLFVPGNQPATSLSVEATRSGITVVRVDEEQMIAFIDEARIGFKRRFGGDVH